MLGRQDYPWYGITLQKNKTFEEDNVVTTLLLSLDQVTVLIWRKIQCKEKNVDAL